MSLAKDVRRSLIIHNESLNALDLQPHEAIKEALRYCVLNATGLTMSSTALRDLQFYLENALRAL